MKARCGDEGDEHIQVKKCGFGEGDGTARGPEQWS